MTGLPKTSDELRTCWKLSLSTGYQSYMHRLTQGRSQEGPGVPVIPLSFVSFS